VILQVGSSSYLVPIASRDVRWVMRDGWPADSPDLLLSALDGAVVPSLAERAYLLGESQVVRALRGALEQVGSCGTGSLPRGTEGCGHDAPRTVSLTDRLDADRVSRRT
jgi:hypothetical protein